MRGSENIKKSFLERKHANVSSSEIARWTLRSVRDRQASLRIIIQDNGESFGSCL